ncbi:MAG: response regulator [Chloroflexi bacterium]|nr:response regulator [Chloroflexota bacterium]
MRALVVDDSVFARRRLMRILRSAGIEVVGEAGHGGAAIARYQELRPDVVTMDLHMPGVDGLAATRAILDDDPAAAIIVVSALNDEQTILRAREAGARAFVLKPYQTSRVLEALRSVLSPEPPAQIAPSAAESAPVSGSGLPEQFAELFLEEAELQLHTIDEAIATLRADPSDHHAADDLYRAVHTLRGMASMTQRTDLAAVGTRLELTARQFVQGVTPTGAALAAFADSLRVVRQLVRAPRPMVETGSTVPAEPARSPESIASVAASPPESAPAPERPPRVLVVDDDGFTRRVLTSFLNREGYQVRIAEDGEEGLHKAQRDCPDLVILDVEMPRLKGVDVCEALRDHPATHDVLILMVTVKDELEVKLSAFAAGADDYVTKPFEPEEVIARAKALLSRARRRK